MSEENVMHLDSISQLMGQLAANQNSMTKTLNKIDTKVDSLNSFQSATEERLKNGNRKFQDQGKTIKENTDAIDELEKKVPSGGMIYGSIYMGFIVLGALIAYFGLLK